MFLNHCLGCTSSTSITPEARPINGELLPSHLKHIAKELETSASEPNIINSLIDITNFAFRSIENKKAIGDHYLLFPLIKHMQSDRPNIQNHAINALIIVSAHPDNMRIIATASTLDFLIQKVSSQNKKNRAEAARLARIIITSGKHAHDMNSAKQITLINTYLLDSNPLIKIECAKILDHQLEHNRLSLEMFNASSLSDSITQLIQDHDEIVRQHGAKLAGKFAKDPTIKSHLIKNHVPSLLIELLNDIDFQQDTLESLKPFLTGSPSILSMDQPKYSLFKYCIELIKDERDELRLLALQMVLTLSSHITSHKWRTIIAIRPLLKDSNHEIRTLTFTKMTEELTEDDINNHVKDPSIITDLENMAKDQQVLNHMRTHP